MLKFEQIHSGIYLLKVPFSGLWTGVTLVKGQVNCLIDSGATPDDVDQLIIPALHEMGMELNDIDWLLNTHSHGDHMGGHARLRQLSDHFKVAAHESSAPKIENPVPYAIKTRTRFPAHSPAPQSALVGIPVDKVLRDRDCIGDRLQLIHTPGHDDDCVCWFDKETRTLITGDTLQGNGTATQGIGFYKSLDGYLYTLDTLMKLGAENILCGHDYDQIGWNISGAKNVQNALQTCLNYSNLYEKFIRAQYEAGERDPAKIAEKLINTHGCVMPDLLFMSMYTTTQHLEKIEKGA